MELCIGRMPLLANNYLRIFKELRSYSYIFPWAFWIRTTPFNTIFSKHFHLVNTSEYACVCTQGIIPIYQVDPIPLIMVDQPLDKHKHVTVIIRRLPSKRTYAAKHSRTFFWITLSINCVMSMMFATTSHLSRILRSFYDRYYTCQSSVVRCHSGYYSWSIWTRIHLTPLLLRCLTLSSCLLLISSIGTLWTMWRSSHAVVLEIIFVYEHPSPNRRILRYVRSPPTLDFFPSNSTIFIWIIHLSIYCSIVDVILFYAYLVKVAIMFLRKDLHIGSWSCRE